MKSRTMITSDLRDEILKNDPLPKANEKFGGDNDEIDIHISNSIALQEAIVQWLVHMPDIEKLHTDEDFNHMAAYLRLKYIQVMLLLYS